jgi:EcoRII C terminal
MEKEERLFRALERHIVSERLEKGFVTDGKADVDAFISLSLSIQNRRKSRAGYAFGNHVEAILKTYGIVHKREAKTERDSRPDFLFPSVNAYQDDKFPDGALRMLAVKTTCKDRWRQVLAEADRIKNKHLLTLEPGISENQTNEMQARKLQLVLPKQLHSTYTAKQQGWLFSVQAFIDLVQKRAK